MVLGSVFLRHLRGVREYGFPSGVPNYGSLLALLLPRLNAGMVQVGAVLVW